LASTLLGAFAARASVPDSYGFGSRSTSMAGAVTADASDFSAGYYNPAGLVEADAVEISAGYFYTAQRLQVDGADNEVEDVHGLVAGVVAPGKIGPLPFAFGVGVHLPDDGISFIKARRQGVPRWELYDTRAHLLYLEAGLAIRPVEWLELGGGIAYLSATRGSFDIRGRAITNSPFDSQLEHEVDADLTSVRFPQAGFRLLLDGFGALGATYRGESKLELSLDAHLEGIVEVSGIDVPLLYEIEARTIAAFTPQQLAIGLSFQRIDKLHVNLDVTWMNWSAYESPTATITGKLEVVPPPGTPVDLPDQPVPPILVPPAFRDRLVPRVGIEYSGAGGGAMRRVHGEDHRLVEIPLRAGYVYEPTPVPDQSGETNLIDSDRHTWTVGIGVAINRPLDEIPGSVRLDAHGTFSWLVERTFLKDNPADFVGDYTAGGTQFGGGGTLGLTF
jgi:long-chain fatty acid transport protein